MKHVDFSTMYISTVEDPGDGPVGYNVQIVLQPHFGHPVVRTDNVGTASDWWCTDCEEPVPFHVCDMCGHRDAEYILDAAEDLGIASCNQGSCQHCMVWSFNHQPDTGDNFQEKP